MTVFVLLVLIMLCALIVLVETIVACVFVSKRVKKVVCVDAIDVGGGHSVAQETVGRMYPNCQLKKAKNKQCHFHSVSKDGSWL